MNAHAVPMAPHYMLWAGSIIEVEPYGPPISKLHRDRLKKRAVAIRKASAKAVEWAAANPIGRSLSPAVAIIDDVAKLHGIDPIVLRIISCRQVSIVRARDHAIAEVADKTSLSLTRIGRLFNGRDHSTILHSIINHNRRTGQNIRGLGARA
jgi:chromosomal replication initiation ATPase DnaA